MAGPLAQFFFVYTLGTGQIMTVHNQLQGYGPTFEAYVAMPYLGNFGFGSNGLHFYTCRFSKTGFPLKNNAWVESPFEFEAYPNAAGNWFDLFENDVF